MSELPDQVGPDADQLQRLLTEDLDPHHPLADRLAGLALLDDVVPDLERKDGQVAEDGDQCPKDAAYRSQYGGEDQHDDDPTDADAPVDQGGEGPLTPLRE